MKKIFTALALVRRPVSFGLLRTPNNNKARWSGARSAPAAAR